ncbi:AMP-binding protein [Mycobacterium sp. CBMA293]|uniref:AMP-binding protein n=1 Tax=unclassified Mycolicibacterium TaxID=2636767 RepID=UPI0012DD3B6E|nr:MULTISPECIES: AMP-binding protein [unclassified Mycolicibacterium]MUL49892.1 AMP-binding protein [Mycolicibacterium sp. CBMA 360]MUL62711.1 AMP-binding protein [Mycolicibacterium sp. CBMA 335]MUL70741.1 AMP-binding protein [Mycolicibacterium sp. CBMA 311]MUL97235.1 AMP-binding protein [Mycolicibacterium sp. CBMA 230]MUM07983.1 AMP-dependent synthetase [Mycolicibacterium sp. CBMA 213]
MTRHSKQTEDRVSDWLATYGAAEANAAELLVDRHDPNKVAITFVVSDSKQIVSTPVTYGELAEYSKRLATALVERGVRQGSTVGVLMSKRIEMVISLLALARIGAIYIPLFTAFAEAAIESRLRSGAAHLVITEPDQLAKVSDLDGIDTLVTGEEFDRLFETSAPLQKSVSVGANGTVVLLFTSGTSGPPKGVPVPVRSFAAFSSYMHYGLDVSSDDVFWNAADPGWAYGLYYGVIGPMVTGRANILLQGNFSPDITSKVITGLGVSNFTAAPTVYRAMSKHRPPSGGITLRRASSAGEPLTAGISQWAEVALGVEIRDHYGQTEHGMLINNHWASELRRPLIAGSMGRTMPGFSADIVGDEIAVNVNESPLMWFTGYLDDPEKTAERFTADKRYYLTGDSGRMDTANNFYFTARNDDVIIMAGYRIGPSDVEDVLSKHPAVADVAVVGRPDEIRGEVLEAFVVVVDHAVGDATLEAELQQLVKTTYSAHAYPRRVHFIDTLPRTSSGKVQRFVLRAR